ncbi:hypothetical protein Fcan01_05138 [Folsomia candida]|uniref:Uncharacterized protein n=1 Tax=Folsomia candida TaxID=158441 RepID=A0A226ERZ2_FOLCA|nr:hypothetical protein Fcan01_05138 [Folsomia candida]
MSLALLVLTVSLVVVSMNYSATNVPSVLSLSSNTFDIFGLKNFSSVNVNTDDHGVISKDNLTIVHNGQLFYNEKYVVAQAVNQAMGVIIMGIVICTIYIILDVQLWIGANDRNVWRCNVWFQVQLANSLISLILTPVVMVVMIPHVQLGMLIACIGQAILVFYIMWVIYAFIKELELGGSGKVEGPEEAFITKY